MDKHSQLRRICVNIAQLAAPCAPNIIEEIREILDDAQNTPPLGKADGSMRENTWAAVTALVRAAQEYNVALLHAVSLTQADVLLALLHAVSLTQADVLFNHAKDVKTRRSTRR